MPVFHLCVKEEVARMPSHIAPLDDAIRHTRSTMSPLTNLIEYAHHEMTAE